MKSTTNQEITRPVTSLTLTEGDNAPFLPFPDEINLSILRFFSSKDLRHGVAGVNKNGYRLASAIQAARLQKMLDHSPLWRCLPTLAGIRPEADNNSAFKQYVISLLGSAVVIPADWEASLVDLASFIECWVRKMQMPLAGLTLGVASAADIQTIASDLLVLMQFHETQDAFSGCENFKDFINLSKHDNSLELCQQYDALDKLFSSLVLLMGLSLKHTDNRLYFLITHTQLCRGVTGGVLAAMRRICPANMELTLIKEGLRRHDLAVKTPNDDRILSDIEAYLAQLGVEELLKIELTSTHSHRFSQLLVIPYLLRSHRLLQQLSKRALIKCLKRIEPKDIEKVFKIHPTIYHFLSADVLISWIKISTSQSKLVKIFLTHKSLLENFNHDVIVALAKYIRGGAKAEKDSDFGHALAHPVFKEKLANDPDRSKLLVKMGGNPKAKCPMLAIDIARDPEAALMLSPEEVMQLLKSCSFSRKHFAKRTDVLCRFNSAQLTHLLNFSIDEFYQTIFSRLDLFTNEDLIRVAEKYLDSYYRRREPDKVVFFLGKLSPELVRRSRFPEAEKLTSQQWCRLGCSAPQASLLIARHYPPLLPEDQLRKLRSCYYKNVGFTDERTLSQVLQIIFMYFTGVCGIILLLTGIGSLSGFMLAIEATSCLFASLPFSAPLTSCCVGLIALMTPFIYSAYYEEDRTLLAKYLADVSAKDDPGKIPSAMTKLLNLSYPLDDASNNFEFH